MKPYLFLLNLIVALALCLGCKNLSPQGKAYVALADTQVAVDAAMKVYAAKWAAGKVGPETSERIDTAHFNYTVAFESAVELARFNYDAATPDTVAELASKLLTLIGQLNR